jgi:hypothetical protein
LFIFHPSTDLSFSTSGSPILRPPPPIPIPIPTKQRSIFRLLVPSRSFVVDSVVSLPPALKTTTFYSPTSVSTLSVGRR